LKSLLLCLILLATFFYPATILCEISGVLLDTSGNPIPDTTVLLAGLDITTTTAPDGTFQFDADPGTYTLIVLDREISVTFSDDTPASVQLDIYSETLLVDRPASVSQVIDQSDLKPSSGINLTELLSKNASYHQAGLGGALSTVSIGGFSGHRVQTTVNGYRVVGDRRAGSDLGTIIPGLMEEVEVFRGGTGTTHGSEAMGGVIDAGLPSPDGHSRGVTAEFMYGENNKRLLGNMVLNTPNFIAALGYDDAGSYTTPDGSEEDGFYTRSNLLLGYRWEKTRRLTFFDFFYGRGRDIGKASAAPVPTVYPEDDLIIAGIRSWGESLDYQFGLIRQYLSTERDTERSEIGSINFHGSTFYHRKQLNLGVELYTRQNVNANVTLDTGNQEPLDDASRWEVSPVLFYDFALPHDFNLNIGARYSFFQAANTGTTVRDTFLSGNGTLSWQSGAGLFTLGIFRTYRFPTLEELFYSGLTGRGYVEGNPGLLPEKGASGHVSWERPFKGITINLSYFLQGVRDYIEKVRIEEDLYSFRNLGRVRIQDFSIMVSKAWVSLGMAWTKGIDLDTGEAVDGIPPVKFTVNLQPVIRRFTPYLHILLAKDQENVGPHEKAVSGYADVDLGISCEFSSYLTAGIHITNLFNRAYFPSADELSVYAPGRSFSISIKLDTGF